MIKSLEYSKCLYFGCIKEAGHYLFAPQDKNIYGEWHRWIAPRDGLLAPTFCREAGKALLHHYDGFTVLAFWDYSVDKRPGSNSMFIVPGIKSFHTTMQAASKYFPQVCDRFSFKIEQYISKP